MYELLRNKTRGLMADATACLRELIQIPSLSGHECDVARAVKRAYGRCGLDRVVSDEFGNVVGVLLGRESRPVVLLLSHLDTVSQDAGGEWSKDPFGGDIEKDRMYGLGATDCKGGIVTQLFAAALLKRALLPLDGSVVVAATASEENGKSLGLRALLEHTLPSLGLTPTHAILGEPTNNGIYYGHDGWMEVRVQVQGANPFQVSDAAGAIYDDLSQTRAGAGVRDDAETFAVTTPQCSDEGGLRRAQIELARRLGPDDRADSIVGQIRHNAELAAGGCAALALEVAPKQVERTVGQLRTRVACVAEAWSTDPFSPLVDRARQALSAARLDARPGRWQLGRLGTGTAGGTLVRRYGIPTIGYGPGDEALAHAPDECVELARVQEAVLGTAIIVHALAGVPTFGWTTDDP
ncbi:MAG: M20/M25/M40 family metallo-hydrolase [Polyangiaceae bacterium]|nr:M20/M25/M40 family metallo-hydrolase [Polyangiaceae bacterium]